MALFSSKGITKHHGETLMDKHYILAVDDEELNLIILEELLADKYELHCVTNGLHCLDSVSERQPDLILMDVNMPAMSGLEVCSRLKTTPKHANVPIIMLSALASATETKNGLKMGANAYISKPFEESKLLDTLYTYLA